MMIIDQTSNLQKSSPPIDTENGMSEQSGQVEPSPVAYQMENLVRLLGSSVSLPRNSMEKSLE